MSDCPISYNPFSTPAPLLCDDGVCDDCSSSVTPECFVYGYTCEAYDACTQVTPPCLEGGTDCLDCEGLFQNYVDTKFLGGYVAGASAKLGFGASESTVNIDLILLKRERDYSTPCEGSTKICDPEDMEYTGSLGYLYTFNLGSFCFRGILTNHNYSSGSDGFKYRITMTDGKSILNNVSVILNGTYSRPPDFQSGTNDNIINVLYELESSVGDDICGNGEKCNDFMLSGANKRGILLKKALQGINLKQIRVPISGLCLTLDVSKLIRIVPEEYRTTNLESSVLDLITLACEESGYDFISKITNDNRIEIIPINYRYPVENKPLYQFIVDLINQDTVIGHEYGEEVTYEKDKKIIYGDNIYYITEVNDVNRQVSCDSIPMPSANCGIVGDPGSQPDTRSSDPDQDSYTLQTVTQPPC